MRSLSIDLARKPDWFWFWVLLGVGLVGAASVLAVGAWLDRNRVQAMADESQRMRSHLRAAHHAARDAAVDAGLFEDAALWLHTASADVPRLLAEIESIKGPGVRILSIDMDAERREVLVELVANDLAAVYLAVRQQVDAPSNPVWRLEQGQLAQGGAVTARLRGRIGDTKPQ